MFNRRFGRYAKEYLNTFCVCLKGNPSWTHRYMYDSGLLWISQAVSLTNGQVKVFVHESCKSLRILSQEGSLWVYSICFLYTLGYFLNSILW